MDEKTFQAPSTPGWKLLLDAANAVTDSEATPKKLDSLLNNMEARQNELIPGDHRDEVFSAVYDAGIRIANLLADGVRYPDVFTVFFHGQLGREGWTEMLEKKGGWTIKDCNCSEPGYHVWTNDEEKLKAAETDPIEELLETIFGAGPGGIMIIGGHTRRRPKDDQAAASNHKPAEQSAPASS